MTEHLPGRPAMQHQRFRLLNASAVDGSRCDIMFNFSRARMRSHRQQYHDAGSHKANSLQTGNGCIEPSKLHTRAHKHHFNTASHSLWTSLLKLPQHGWIVAAPPPASVMLMMYTSTLSLHGGRMLMQRSSTSLSAHALSKSDILAWS